MSKRIALTDYIEVDGADLSNDCRAISSNFEHNRVDVSGFSASGTDEFLLGNTTREITATFFSNPDTGHSFPVLKYLFEEKAIFDFVWRKDVNAGVSASNPELRGAVQLTAFPQGANRGDPETFDVTFTQAAGTILTWHYS